MNFTSVKKRMENLEASKPTQKDEVEEIYLVGVNPGGSKNEPVLLWKIDAGESKS